MLDNILKMILILFLLQVLQVSTLVRGQCFGETKSESKSSGVIRSPGYPGNYYEMEKCSWVVAKQLNDYAIAIDVKEVQTSYVGSRKKRCSGTITLNDEKLDCFSSTPFCNIYKTSKCNDMTTASSDLTHCVPKSMNKRGVEIDLDTEFFLTLSTQRFRIQYTILDCSQDFVTSNSTKVANRFIRPIDVATTASFNSSHVAKTDESSQTNIEVIVIPICLISLIVLVLIALLFWRSKHRPQQVEEQKHEHLVTETYDAGDISSQNNGELATGTYGEWQENIPSISENAYEHIGYTNNDNTTPPKNATETAIYEVIPADQHGYSVAEPNPLYTGYAFADKGYVDIDGKYAMAANDNSIPLDNVYEPTSYEAGIPRCINTYEMADKRYELVDGQYAMADTGNVEVQQREQINHEYQSTGQPYEMAMNDNPYELPIPTSQEN